MITTLTTSMPTMSTATRNETPLCRWEWVSTDVSAVWMNSQCRYLDCRDHILNILSMGFGFVNYLFKASSGKPLKTLQHSRLGDHCLELKRSTRASVNKDNGAKEIVDLCKASTKILVRNIPFQAKKEEIVQLFRTFGKISAVRLP